MVTTTVDGRSRARRTLRRAPYVLGALLLVSLCYAADLLRADLPSLVQPAGGRLTLMEALPTGPPAPSPSAHDLRVDVAEFIVRTLYNHRGRANFLPYVEHLVDQHEWYEQEGHRKGYTWAEGFADAYWYSLVYGGANFSLRCYAVAPGNCAGPLDVKHYPLILDPKRNVEWHVAEMWVGQRKGYRGLGLCRYTMLPAAPRDWGNHIFARTNARHRKIVEEAYRDGTLERQVP